LLIKLHTTEVENWLEQKADSFCFAKITNSASWDDKYSEIEFHAVFLNCSNSSDCCRRVMICLDGDDDIFSSVAENAKERISNGALAFDQYIQVVNALAGADFDLTKPLRLSSVSIKKPWGQEIWFTGVEKRGVSCVLSCSGSPVLLPLLTELLPNTLLSQSDGELILLKILDPLSIPVLGDLYFELHEKKQEVYVVTHVDPDAWPDKVGGIRYGFDQKIVASFNSEKELRAAYLKAVKAYEHVRRQLDELIDIKRQEFNYKPDERIENDVFDLWFQSFDESVITAERELRNNMERFSAIKPLRVGDVVKVPLYMPHSLQHGVRTIEFQTPVYERMILSFGQKVLTQNHWDTERVINLIDISEPEEPPFEQLVTTDDVLVERIVDFDDFEVLRVVLAPGYAFQQSLDNRYWLAMGVDGELIIGSDKLINESALLLPTVLNSVCFCNNGLTKATLLLASPKLTEDSC
jgi:hypothetical protein